MNTARVFEDSAAIRGQMPLLFGLIGPSSSGKTYSALRLATGMQRVFGGDIFVIDTESGRAKHYADLFRFRHVPFAPPFSPLDYIDAIEHCVKKGAKTIIVDSLSHEHSGQGGVLEWHQAEVERIMAAWRVNEDKANIPAWGKPKAARRKLINCITQTGVNLLACFRAKDKIKVGSGKVVQLGWMPDAGEEFVFELTAKALLLPGAGGVPTWKSDQVGEQTMIKLPEQFRGIFSGAAGRPLDEDIGQQLAQWAAGSEAAKPPTAAEYEVCKDRAGFDALETRRAAVWDSLKGPQRNPLKAASDAAKARLAKPAQFDPAAALQSIKEAGDLTVLEQAWSAIFSHFDACNEEVPNELHAAYTFAKESLAK